jgi:hypothetical protein
MALDSFFISAIGAESLQIAASAPNLLIRGSKAKNCLKTSDDGYMPDSPWV